MLAIRLFRIGKKNQPAFKVVVTDKTRPTRAGRFLEILGFYNTLTKKRAFKADRIKYWLSVGAKTSDTVHNLLVSEKIISGKKIPSHNKAPREADKSAPTGQVEKTVEPAPIAASEAPKADLSSDSSAEDLSKVEASVKEEAPVEQPKEDASSEALAKKETPVAEEKPVKEPKAEEVPAETLQPATPAEENK